MEEKEERIFIRKGTEIELCKFIYRDGCAGEMHCCSCAISIPRSEVIKRMAKALEEKSEQMGRECLSSDPYNNPLGAEDLAEAALDSLLEEQK